MIAVFCLLGMTAITGIDIIGRYFNHPIFGSEELVSILAVLGLAFILPLSHRERSHIRVEIVFRLLPKIWQKILRIFGCCLSIILFAAIAWRMVLYAMAKQKSGVVTMNLEIPETGFILILAVCFLVVTCMMAFDLIQYFKREE